MPEAIPLKPNLGPNNALLPPLPSIITEAIRLQVFTHRSYHGRPVHIFEDHPDDPSPDNEKFEHLGDTVLGLCVTGLLSEIYPNLRVGPSTKIRALIVGNATLANISVMYRLPERLRLHPAQAITLRASTNVQADLLEAFIGGLYTEQGLDVVRRWLNPLFKPYAREAYKIVRDDYGLEPAPEPTVVPLSGSSAANIHANELTTAGHLALFNQKLQTMDSEIEWIYSDKPQNIVDAQQKEQKAPSPRNTPIWFAKVVINGEVYGYGKGNTKKAARNEAAKVGLVKMGIIVWCVSCYAMVTLAADVLYILDLVCMNLGLSHSVSRLELDSH